MDEEARMRAVLAEMQLRISQGPNAALGLGDAYAPEDVRAAFLALTKQFHPARFGRMASDVQKISNEVFLGIKAAHDLLMRTLGASSRPTGSIRGTGAIARPTNTPAAGSPAVSGSIPRVNGTSPPATQPLARGTDRATGRVSVDSAGQTGGFARVEPTPPPVVSRTNTPIGHPGSIPSGRTTGSIPVTRPTTTGSIPRVDPAAINPPTQRGAQPPSSAPPNRPSAPSLPPSSTNFNIATQRGFGTGPGSPPAPAVQPTQPVARPTPNPTAGGTMSADDQSIYREALRYIQQTNWSAARTSLLALAAKPSTAKQYQSLLHYARGREAQVSGNFDAALAEYQRALEVDPDLSVVKQAVAELQRRR